MKTRMHGNFLERFFPVPDFLHPISPAIDISQSSIKYLSGRSDHGTIFPYVFDEVLLPSGVIEKGEIKQPKVLLQALSGLVKKYQITAAHFSLPEEGAYIYPLAIPESMQDPEVRSRIEFSLSEHVPIPPESVVYDTLSVQGQHIVSVVAYDTRVSAMYEAILEDLGVMPLSFEPHTVSSCRSAVPTGSQEAVLLVDIGRSRTSLAIVYNGIPLTTTTVPIGGSCVTDTIMNVLGITHEESHELKTREGLGLVRTYPELTQPLLTCLDSWVAHMMDFEYLWRGAFNVDNIKIPEVERAILSGGEAAVPGYVEWMEKRFRLPMTIADVWVNMFSYDEYIPRIQKEESARLSTVAGLLMKNNV